MTYNSIPQDRIISLEELQDLEYKELEEDRTMEKALEEVRAYLSIYDGEIENAAYLLGQSAGLINKIESIKDIIETIVKDAEKCLKNAYATIK